MNSNYLREKSVDVDNRLFNFEKSIKNLSNNGDEMNMIVE